MHPENLSEKYQQLLQENRSLKDRIAFLESALNQAGVSLSSETVGVYVESTPKFQPLPVQASAHSELEENPKPSFNRTRLGQNASLSIAKSFGTAASTSSETPPPMPASSGWKA